MWGVGFGIFQFAIDGPWENFLVYVLLVAFEPGSFRFIYISIYLYIYISIYIYIYIYIYLYIYIYIYIYIGIYSYCVFIWFHWIIENRLFLQAFKYFKNKPGHFVRSKYFVFKDPYTQWYSKNIHNYSIS